MPQADGELITMPWDSDRAKIEKTIQCVHCGAHHVIKEAFERACQGKLGFCARCNGPTCGRAICEPCVPQEQQLENMEAGIVGPEVKIFRPTKVSFFIPD